MRCRPSRESGFATCRWSSTRRSTSTREERRTTSPRACEGRGGRPRIPELEQPAPEEQPTAPESPPPRPRRDLERASRRRSSLLLWTARVLLLAVAFLIGLVVGRALEDAPRP